MIKPIKQGSARPPIIFLASLLMAGLLLAACSPLECNTDIVTMGFDAGDFPTESTLVVSYEKAYNPVVIDAEGNRLTAIRTKLFGEESEWSAYVAPPGWTEVRLQLAGKRWSTRLLVTEDRRIMLTSACQY